MDDFATIAARHGLSPECQADLIELLAQGAGPWATTSTRISALPSIEQTFSLDATDEQAPSPASTGSQRYEDLGLLGVGGLAEVRRVLDRDLNRTVAMKVLHSKRQVSPAKLAEFIAEAQLTARLQHPGVVPIYDLGRRPDGRLYFTMREVKGQSLRDWMVTWRNTPAEDREWRQALSIVQRVCEAVGYAHAQQVLHRDLKPANVMLGEHGTVCVVDWGLATVLGPRQRAAGGTPAFMAPEQARGETGVAASDVYGLGGILMELLTGVMPWSGVSREAVLTALRTGQAVPWTGSLPGAPEEMCVLARASLSPSPTDRPQEAEALARRIQQWLGGAKRREQAMRFVDEASALRASWVLAIEEAKGLRTRAQAMRDATSVRAPTPQKRPAWEAEDQADHVERSVVVLEAQHLQKLRGALNLSPDLGAAHRALASWFHLQHGQAEAIGDVATALGHEQFLRHHDRTGEYRAYLGGRGTLELTVDAPDATAQLFRYRRVDRRLVPVPHADLGRLPVRGYPIEMGSYIAVIRAPGRVDMRLPIYIDRGRAWRDVLTMPRRLPADSCTVAEGWFWSGGDSEVPCLPRRRLWIPGFVMQRYPVCNRDYLAFLDDLVRTNREQDALQHVPRERAGTADESGPMIYGRSDDGSFHLRPDAEGDVWQPLAPVLMVDWPGAVAYADWRAVRDGVPWRLPMEFEWEKAARGVDGRRYPWGDQADPTWMCIRDSHEGPAMPPVRDQFPGDESPYGVRGMAGGVRDWCLDLGLESGPRYDDDRLIVADDRDTAGPRVYRGGDWYGLAMHARLAYRAWNKPATKNYSLGFRLCYSL